MLLDAKWITYKTGEYKTMDDQYGNPSPYFRRTFSVRDNMVRATLFASALGVFKIYLNGEAVSDDYLSPGWVDYSKKLPFVRYDITEKLSQRNAIGVVLGDGWAVGHIGSNYTFKRNGYSDRIEFSASVKIEYEDGTVETIITDDSWKASSGEIQRSDIYMGEYVDHRLSKGDFSSADYDDSQWDNAEETVFKFSRNLYLEEAKVPPIVVKHVFKPVLVSQDNGVSIYDVTQNISGVLKCVFRGERGAKVVVRHGELLVDGALYTENLRKAEATDTFILSGDAEEQFRPLFTYHGFQYAELTFEGNVELLDITAEAMYSDLKSTGCFRCSDPITTKVYQNALWGQRDNFLNVPTDCPQRDERLGWTGDAQIFCRSAMWNMDCRVFYEKYLADIRDAQLGNGVIPAAAPLPHVGYYDYTGREAAAGWCEAIAEIPYAHYRMYGDKKIIRDNLPALKRLLDYYEIESPDGIRIGTGGYGDWLSMKPRIDISVISTMYYARAADIASKLCHIIGDYEETYYRDLYLKIKEAFRTRFVDEDGRIKSDTQSAYVIGFQFGLINEREAKENLVRKLDEDGGKLTTGFLGVKFLLPTLCDVGRSDLAYKLITSTDYPGWGYSVVNGATTIWEHWDSYTKENGIKKGMNSFNHYSLGSCTEWMYEYCLGIRPDVKHPNFEKMTISPFMDLTGKITSAEGYYDTAHGRISVSWKKVDDGFEYAVTVPAKIECEFVFNGMEIRDEHREDDTRIFRLQENTKK